MIKLNRKEQKQVLKSLEILLVDYHKYLNFMLDSPPTFKRGYPTTDYAYFDIHISIKEAVKRIFDRVEFPQSNRIIKAIRKDMDI